MATSWSSASTCDGRPASVDETREALPAAEGLVTTRAGAGTRVSVAAVLPASVVTRIRQLAVVAKRESATEDDVIAALRQAWRA